MEKIKGISQVIVNILLERSNKLGQGRSVGVLGFVDKQGIISSYAKVVNGGQSSLPFNKLLATVLGEKSSPLLEKINCLADNTVIISTAPGKTGVIISTGGINIFDLPVVKIGIKHKKAVGVGILYPESKLFTLASISEKEQLNSLAAINMEEERQAMRSLTELRLQYLDISKELPILDIPAKEGDILNKVNEKRILPEYGVKSLDKNFAQRLVDKSIEVEQGREVAAFGIIDKKGHVKQASELVVGGMGYVPARMLVSSYQDISTISLRQAYTNIIPLNAVIVHTHPGGTGVMHMGDAMAGPGTWGRPIVAIGHNELGQVKGATVIEFSSKISTLNNEYETIEEEFFMVESSEEEAKLRKRKYEIAQEFTDFCQEIIIK